MLNDRITLTKADASAQNYDAVKKFPTSTVRSDATRDLDQPQTITVSHEETRDGKRRNSVILLDKVVLDAGDLVTLGTARLQFKASFDKQQITFADLLEMKDQMVELLNSPDFFTKFSNQEH